MNISDFSQLPIGGWTYAKNEVPPFVITTQSTLLAILTIGNSEVFKGSYSPDFNGQITIDFNGLYDNYLKTLIPTTESDVITHSAYRMQFTATFYVLVGEDTAGEPATRSWYVANASIKSSLTFSAWSAGKFLTNQPLEKPTNYEAPEWLTYLDLDGDWTLKVRFYPKNGGNTDVVVNTDAAVGCFSVNVRYGRLIRMTNMLPSQVNGFYDLILFNAKDVEICRQRYIYEERSGREKYFCFINALGGIDTLICSGANALEPEITHNIGRFGRQFVALDDTDDCRKWVQQTGMMPYRWRNWFFELMATKKDSLKYDAEATEYQSIVIDTSEMSLSDHGQLVEATFGYLLNEVSRVISDQERAVDRSLHQSVADQAAAMDDLTQQMTLEFEEVKPGYATDTVTIPATKLYVEFDESPSVIERQGTIEYSIDGVLAGDFQPGVDPSPVVITKAVGESIQFTSQDHVLDEVIIRYYQTNIIVN